MSKTVKVTYNADTLETTIVVDGKNFDTSRITGKEMLTGHILSWYVRFVGMVSMMKW